MTNKDNVKALNKSVMSLCDIVESLAKTAGARDMPYIRSVLSHIKEELGGTDD